MAERIISRGSMQRGLGLVPRLGYDELTEEKGDDPARPAQRPCIFGVFCKYVNMPFTRVSTWQTTSHSEFAVQSR